MLQIRKYENLIKAAPIVVFDGNLTIDAMSTILELCRKYNKPGEFEYFIVFLLKSTKWTAMALPAEWAA